MQNRTKLQTKKKTAKTVKLYNMQTRKAMSSECKLKYQLDII